MAFLYPVPLPSNNPPLCCHHSLSKILSNSKFSSDNSLSIYKTMCNSQWDLWSRSWSGLATLPGLLFQHFTSHKWKTSHTEQFVSFLTVHSLLSVRAGHKNHLTLPGSFGMSTLILFPLETHIVRSSSHMERLHGGTSGSAEPSPGAKHINEEASRLLWPQLSWVIPALPAGALGTRRQRQTIPAVSSEFLTHRINEHSNTVLFSVINFGVVCYSPTDDWDTLL